VVWRQYVECPWRAPRFNSSPAWQHCGNTLGSRST
jgi:hypothetical protein